MDEVADAIALPVGEWFCVLCGAEGDDLEVGGRRLLYVGANWCRDCNRMIKAGQGANWTEVRRSYAPRAKQPIQHKRRGHRLKRQDDPGSDWKQIAEDSFRLSAQGVRLEDQWFQLHVSLSELKRRRRIYREEVGEFQLDTITTPGP